MILSFTKPKKKTSTKEHNAYYSSDSGIDGTYVPNMTEADMKTWKAKVVGSRSGNHQIEIRKTLRGAQMLIVVNGKMSNYVEKTGWNSQQTNAEMKPHLVKMSANGAMLFNSRTWVQLEVAVSDAMAVLRLLDDKMTCKQTLKLIRDGQLCVEEK